MPSFLPYSKIPKDSKTMSTLKKSGKVGKIGYVLLAISIICCTSKPILTKHFL